MGEIDLNWEIVTLNKIYAALNKRTTLKRLTLFISDWQTTKMTFCATRTTQQLTFTFPFYFSLFDNTASFKFKILFTLFYILLVRFLFEYTLKYQQ